MQQQRREGLESKMLQVQRKSAHSEQRKHNTNENATWQQKSERHVKCATTMQEQRKAEIEQNRRGISFAEESDELQENSVE